MIKKPNFQITPLKLAYTALFSALTLVATYSFVINIPSTGGYFNLGEIIIYVSALVFGPFVGGIAGGVGSAISDALVAPQFAPGTLVIKGLEGAIVGFLGKRKLAQITKTKWTVLTATLGVVVGIFGASRTSKRGCKAYGNLAGTGMLYCVRRYSNIAASGCAIGDLSLGLRNDRLI